MNDPAQSAPLLALTDLSVTFETNDGLVQAVKGLSLQVQRGECVGLVGESGSGKSQSMMAALGLLAKNGRASGSVKLLGEEILGLPPEPLRAIRGKRISVIFQDPLTSLTPHLRIRTQMGEVLATHLGLKGAAAETRMIEWLERVRIPEARRRLDQYPHELSGGMRQRVMIAMCMALSPEVLIADEPTTALDVTVQAQVLELMADLQRETQMGLVLITHDMGVVARLADRVCVMRLGEKVEDGPVNEIFASPQHDYTRHLIGAAPRLDRPGRNATTPDATAEPLLSAHQLMVRFPVTVSQGLFPKTVDLRAVDGVDLALKPGETLGIVGESGCGKSTLARALLALQPYSKGEVAWLGATLPQGGRDIPRAKRRDFQIVFQDPFASLDPRMTIGQSVAEPLALHEPSFGIDQREARVRDMLRRVGLNDAMFNRYPHELSGGQNQRVGIARAMILKPKVLVCDEAVSALDVSVRAQVLDLLGSLQAETGTAMLFISHDLAVVRDISHRVMVLYLGRVVETADTATLFSNPRHPYTQALLAAAPIPDPKVERNRVRVRLEGDLPSPLDPRAQLRFMKSKLVGESAVYRPVLMEINPGHWVAEHDPFDQAPGLFAA